MPGSVANEEKGKRAMSPNILTLDNKEIELSFIMDFCSSYIVLKSLAFSGFQILCLYIAM